MNNNNNKKNSAVSEFIAGKGFYIALFVSIAMIGTACYFAYTQTSNNITNQLENLSSITSSDTDSQYEVDNPQTSIPKVTEATSKAETIISNNEKAELGEHHSYSELPVQAPANTAQPIAMPIEGETLMAFSGDELVKSPTTGTWQTHNGIDIAGNLGDQVRAMTSGTITEIADDPLFGVTVVIDHNNGLIGRYCNLNEGVTVEVGAKVAGGSIIGTIGETADIESNQPYHLHFEVTKDGQYIDPTSIITK